MVVSDQGETETFLRSQLDLIHRMLVMEFSIEVFWVLVCFLMVLVVA